MKRAFKTALQKQLKDMINVLKHNDENLSANDLAVNAWILERFISFCAFTYNDFNILKLRQHKIFTDKFQFMDPVHRLILTTPIENFQLADVMIYCGMNDINIILSFD